MSAFTLKSLTGSTLFEVSTAGAVTVAGALASASAAITGAITAASLAVSGALSAASATITGLLTLTPQAATMGTNNKTLIMTGSPTGSQILVTSNVLIVDPTGATRTLTLPAASACTGKAFLILNAGDASADVTDGDGTWSVAAGKGLIAFSNGSGYGALLGA